MIASKSKSFASQKNFQHLLNYIHYQSFSMSRVAAARQNLPNLPVPKLSQTLEKYLKSVEPFLNNCELIQTKKLLTQFQSENGVGEKLQKLLVQKAKQTDNWLADWWINIAYLEYRDPVVVFSSPGLVFPFEKFCSEDERLKYTAKLILAALKYKEVIDCGQMPEEKMGKDPLDMNQYNKIFGTCRIPGLKRDHLEFNPQSKHIVIVRNNNFFKLQVINDSKEIMSFDEVFCNLQSIIKQSENCNVPVGILTSDNRNNWGKAYQDLTLDPCNLKCVREIQTSLFLVSLDNKIPSSEQGRSSASEQLIHGAGSEGNSGNRWYDKTVQFIVSEDGTVGLTYEHSPSEGQPIAVMTDYLMNYIKSDQMSTNQCNTKFGMCPEKLEFNVDDKIKNAIDIASCNINKLANNLDMDAFKFCSYGKEFVKSQKMSPDSYIQIAMQYAFYRIHQVPGAHYESAATRKYIHGRTETIRSCSNESIAFAKIMLDDSKCDNEKVTALKEAINAHKKYSLEAVHGYGVDRHLLGLKLIAIENGIPVPPLYKDPSFTRSTYMRLSTSQVATKCDGFMCYGPLVPDGYGCCYNPRANDINFAVSAFVDHPETTASQFRVALTKSLEEMHNILANTQKSKL